MTTIKETATALGETVLAAKGAVQDIRRSATNMMDQARTDTAGNLHSAASAVRAAGNQGAEAIEDLAADAGKRLDSASSYIAKNDAGDMMHDLRRIVRRHPGTFLLLTASVAVCVGFFAGTRSHHPRE